MGEGWLISLWIGVIIAWAGVSLVYITLWIITKILRKRLAKEISKFEGHFLKTDSEGNTNPNIFIKITYKGRCGFRFSFVDLNNDTEKSYILEIPSESEEYDGQPVLVVHTSRTPELWPYKEDGDGYVNEIRSPSGDCLYRRA